MNLKIKDKLHWRRLDNSAKIFPLSNGKKYSTVFRISAIMKEKVNPRLLQQAVIIALEKYKSFQVRMRAGFFWYYFEQNTKQPIVEIEKNYPCKHINPKDSKGYLFKVTYFENKINIDIYHALTDGNSGNVFFREIIYTYLELLYPEEFHEERKIRKIEYNTEDSYIKNYDKKSKSDTSSRKAYLLKGRKIRLGAISTIHEIIDLEDLKKECQKYEVTITQYLTALLMYCIYKENYLKNKGKKPIRICVPVNLKKYFPSKTISNFFSYIMIEGTDKTNEVDTFEKMLDFVKKEFKKKLSEEEIMKTMSSNVKLGNNILIKAIPLFLKKPIVKLSYTQIRKYTTITLSNLGRIGIIGKYKDYIDYFVILIAPDQGEKIKCSSISFENKITFTFTSILQNNNIEKAFYQFLVDKGIKVSIESNGVLDDIS